MRIAMVSASLGGAFGQERVMALSAEALRLQGHEVVFVSDHETGPVPPCEGFVFLEGLSSLGTLSSPKAFWALRRKLLGFLRTAKPDLVHFVDQLDFRLLDAVCDEFPTLMTAHTVSPTCPASTRLISAGNDSVRGVCQEKSGWSCYTNNKSYGCLDGFKGSLRKLHAIHAYLLKRKVLDRVRVVGAISEYMKQVLLQDGWNPRRVRVISNPIAPLSRVEPFLNPPKNLLVIAARLVPLKGIDFVLRALSPLQSLPWTLWICGEGPLRSTLEERVRELGLSQRVIFKGTLEARELYSTVKAAKVFLQTNIGPEGFGLSVAEAGALGVPAICFDIPALNEIVIPGETGLLVPVKDVKALSAAIASLLTDGPLHAKLSAGAQMASERFTVDKHLKETLQAYHQCLFGTELATESVGSKSPLPAN